MKEAMLYYQGLDSFEVDIVHDNTSGLFPGKYEQHLKVRKDMRFELKVTKPSAEEHRAPDYYSNGTMVYEDWKHKPEASLTEPIMRPNTVPGWEVSSGLLLSWVCKTPTGKTWVNGAPGWEMKFTEVKESEWHEKPVRETTLDMGAPGSDNRFVMTIYFDPEKPIIRGWTSKDFNGKPLELQYKNFKANPDLPETLGDHPKAS